MSIRLSTNVPNDQWRGTYELGPPTRNRSAGQRPSREVRSPLSPPPLRSSHLPCYAGHVPVAGKNPFAIHSLVDDGSARLTLWNRITSKTSAVTFLPGGFP